MLDASQNNELPPIPGKRYFTIGEVSQLCEVKPHVLRYWEQEFPQLKPVKRRGNRRYYQRQDVIVIRQIRSLLYDQGFTIGGARQRLQGEDAKQDQTQFKLLVKQMIVELEDVLRVFASRAAAEVLRRGAGDRPPDGPALLGEHDRQRAQRLKSLQETSKSFCWDMIIFNLLSKVRRDPGRTPSAKAGTVPAVSF